MKAIVLAAGFGTRLAHLTQNLPKPMLPVQGRPLLEYILRNLAWHGCRHVSLNLHYLPELIRGHFGDGSWMGLDICYSYEPELLGTGGGARQMAALLPGDGPLLIHYGDVLTDQDLTALCSFHHQHGGPATMLVHRRPGSNSCVGFAEDGRVSQFLERPTPEERRRFDSPWVNSGICILERDALARLPGAGATDLARDLFPQLVADGEVFAYPLSSYRCAVDSPERLSEARVAVATGRCRLPWQTGEEHIKPAA